MGKHAAPGRLTPKALLGPIRAVPTWEAPYDPFGVQDKQAANEVGQSAEQEERPPRPHTVAPSAPTAEVADPGRAGSSALPRPLPIARYLLRAAELAALGVAGLGLIATARTMPVSTAEAARVVRVVAATRPDVGALPGTFSQRLVDAIGAAWLSATGAAHRHSDAVLAAREPMVIAALAALAVVWIIGWRLRLSVPTRMAMVLALAVSPAARQLLVGAIRPGVLAGLLIVLAIVLIAGPHAGNLSRFAALLSLVVAVLILPAAVPALLATFGVMLIAGDLAGRLPSRVRWGGGVLVILAALAALQYVRIGPARWATVIGSLDPGPTPRLQPVDWLLAVAAGVLLLAAFARPWLREPACAAVMLVVSAAALPDQRPDLLVAAIPIGVLVAAANAEDFVVRPRLRLRWAFRPAALRGWLAAVTAAAMVGLLALSTRQLPASPPTPPLRAVAAWFGSEVAGMPRIGVDNQIWPDLIGAGISPARLVRRPFVADPPWVVSTNPPGQGWVTYATFGTGSTTVRILRQQPLPTTALQLAGSENGAALASNPHLTLTKAAAEKLQAGDVDLRLVFVLGLLAGQHTLVISDFPAVPGEVPGSPPLRRVVITTIDGRPATDPNSAQLLSHWLTEQLDPYRPCQIDQASGALLVRYCVAPANS